MGNYSIDVEECIKASRVFSDAAIKLSAQAVKISQVKSLLDDNYSDVYTTLDYLENKAKQEATDAVKAGTALYRIAKTYEKAEKDVLLNIKNGATFEPTLGGGSHNDFYEEAGEYIIEYLREHWLSLFFSIVHDSFKEEDFGPRCFFTIINAIIDYHNLVKSGMSKEEAMVKAFGHMGIGILVGGVVGGIVGTLLFPGAGTGVGTIAGILVGVAIETIICELLNPAYDWLIDNYWDEYKEWRFSNPLLTSIAGEDALIKAPALPSAFGPRMGTVFG